MDAIKPAQPISLTEWSDGYTSNMIKMIIMTIIFIVLLVLLFTLGNLQEIAKNFPRYRCNPIIMPFASNFGYDTQENFNYCLSSIFNLKAAEIFTPIYALLGQFTKIITLITDVALGIRKLFSNFLFSVNNFIRNVRDRIQGLMFNIRMSFLKINNLMGRVYGTMYAVIWMGTSALTAGMNVSENDLVKFLMEFCFAPDTAVRMADGTTKEISQLQIGDTLAQVRETGEAPRVTSVFRFAGDKTPMVKISDVVLSAEHYVQSPKGWVCARNHPEAEIVPSIPELVCLNVSGHEFLVGNRQLIAADYDEHESADVIQKTQEYAMKHLNNTNGHRDTVDDYSLGMCGSLNVYMANRVWKPLRDIQIGEIVWNSGTVLGIVQEECEDIVELFGTRLSVAQTVFDGTKWIRAGYIGKLVENAKPTILNNLITERCATIKVRNDTREFYVRDYREIADPAMEDEYAEKFLSKIESTNRVCHVITA